MTESEGRVRENTGCLFHTCVLVLYVGLDTTIFPTLSVLCLAANSGHTHAHTHIHKSGNNTLSQIKCSCGATLWRSVSCMQKLENSEMQGAGRII